MRFHYFELPESYPLTNVHTLAYKNKGFTECGQRLSFASRFITLPTWFLEALDPELVRLCEKCKEIDNG